MKNVVYNCGNLDNAGESLDKQGLSLISVINLLFKFLSFKN